VENTIPTGAAYLPAVFRDLFSYVSSAFSASAAAEMGDSATAASGLEEDVEYRQKVKRWRRIATTMLCSPLFMAMVRISSVAKGPMTHFFF